MAERVGTEDASKRGEPGAQESLAASEAADFLGVKLPTLYAYASRGMIRSLPAASGRARRYLREDLEALRERRRGRGPKASGGGTSPALRFGEPLLDTRITAIHAERGPIYRGHPALRLASDGVPFEAVAELLWSGSLPETESLARAGAHDFPFPLPALRRLVPAQATPLEILQIVIPLLAVRDPGRFAEGTGVHRARLHALVRRMAASLALADDARIEEAFAAPSHAAGLAHALGAKRGKDGVRAIDRALVLSADHELNASAFAARVAASTGADLYASVAAALSTLSGHRHGGAADRVEALVAEIAKPEDALRVVHERARRGEMIEGFGHPLYPDGDPRGEALVALAGELAPKSTRVRTCLALCEAMREQGAGGPSLDAGLVALCAALGLARGAAVALFAVGRTAGWVANAFEQAEEATLLRPRARYVGPSEIDAARS